MLSVSRVLVFLEFLQAGLVSPHFKCQSMLFEGSLVYLFNHVKLSLTPTTPRFESCPLLPVRARQSGNTQEIAEMPGSRQQSRSELRTCSRSSSQLLLGIVLEILPLMISPSLIVVLATSTDLLIVPLRVISVTILTSNMRFDILSSHF